MSRMLLALIFILGLWTLKILFTSDGCIGPVIVLITVAR